MAGQLLPRSGSQYREDRAEFVERLRRLKPDITSVFQAFNPYPWALTAAEIAELEGTIRCVQRGLCAIVEHYFEDARLRAVVVLPEAVESLLRLLQNRPYLPGAFRPDFLLPARGGVLVSEINGRFPFNGFFLSHALDAAMQQMPYGDRFSVGYEGLAALRRMPDVFRETFAPFGRIVVVKEEERGYDISLFMDFHGGCRVLPPGGLSATGEDTDFVILELHQHELLRHLPPPALARLIQRGRYINDVRTILIGHDKRLLALLTSDLLSDYLAAEEVNFLRQHVVPTYVIGQDAQRVREAREHPEDWVLKPNLLGKGKGIVMGRSVAAAAWRAALDGADPNYVLQPYIEQQRFPILVEAGGVEQSVAMHVAGLLPAFNHCFFGPGVFRASPEEIVNVSGGGTILAPVLVAPSSPAVPLQG